MKIIKILKNINLSYINNSKYIEYYKKLQILNDTVILDSQHGKNINGNIYYVLKELATNDKYKEYKLYLPCDKKNIKKIRAFLKNKNIDSVNIIKINSRKYYKLLTQAKYLITDTSFPTFYIKKEGQIVLNVWHGTPLKTLGRNDKSEFYRIGNIQRNFALSDYLLYPNKYMMEHMIEDYMITNISNAKIILEGYPRNEIFFDPVSRKKIIDELNLQDKEVFAYMPTWRGVVQEVDDNKKIINYLKEIEQKLTDNQILYVNLHPFVANKINYNKFKKIKPFPHQYETYEFLNIANCLITDYSSVFFDFANTGKKIILFAYDEKQYLEDRGLYLDFKKLPFPKVTDTDSLIKELNSKKEYDDKEFLKQFCNYDNINASKRICEYVILNNNVNIETRSLEKNDKENVLIYAGNLAKNGITTSLFNLLKNVDINEKNYYITFMTRKVKENKEILLTLPKNVNYIPILGKMNLTIKNKLIMLLYNKKLISIEKLLNYVKEDYELEIRRLYGNAKFNTVIQFSGYEYKKILLYSLFKANRILYVHNDAYSEIFKKGNLRLDVSKYAYKNYDKIALVTEDLIEQSSKILDVKEKFYICNNLFDYKRVLKMSKKEVKFDKDTESNIKKEELEKVLNDKKVTKIIAIGRYSKEKGNDRLLKAFEKFYQIHKDVFLIIIGGYGKEYEGLLNKLQAMDCKNNVAFIKSMTNPYTILNKCDGLILPSRYEGFGLVIIEADVLGKPVVSTNIIGPTKFMQKHGGVLVENSVKGIEKGLELLYNKQVKTMNVNYEDYNKSALRQFYQLFE